MQVVIARVRDSLCRRKHFTRGKPWYNGRQYGYFTPVYFTRQTETAVFALLWSSLKVERGSVITGLWKKTLGTKVDNARVTSPVLRSCSDQLYHLSKTISFRFIIPRPLIRHLTTPFKIELYGSVITILTESETLVKPTGKNYHNEVISK